MHYITYSHCTKSAYAQTPVDRDLDIKKDVYGTLMPSTVTTYMYHLLLTRFQFSQGMPQHYTT